MQLLRLAWRSILHSRAKTVTLIGAIVLSWTLPLAAYLFLAGYEQGLLERARSTPLLLGARGSRFDLVLHALYGRGKTPDGIRLNEARKIQESGHAEAIPLHVRHTARGFPLVGTTLEYFERRGLRPARGTLPLRLGDCILGARAAEVLELSPGDRLLSDSRNVFDLAGAVPLRMRVAGVLARTGTPDDDLVLTGIESAWIIDGIGHGHEDLDSRQEELILSRREGNLVANAAVPFFLEVTPENRESFHFHGDRGEFPITAVVVFPRDTRAGTLLRGRYVDPDATVQLLVPEEAVEELLVQVFKVRRFFDAHVLLVAIATVLWLSLVVILSLRLRKRERETMFKLGCSKATVFRLHALELLLVLGSSSILAVGLAGLALLNAPSIGVPG